MGIPTETLSLIVTLIVAGGVIFLIIKMGKDSLFILGGLLIVGSLFVYAKAILIIIGIVLIGLRILVFKGSRNNGSSSGYIKA
jgi:hypothetical protein